MPSLISSELQHLPAMMEGNALGVEGVGHDLVQVFVGPGCPHQAGINSLLAPAIAACTEHQLSRKVLQAVWHQLLWSRRHLLALLFDDRQQGP